MNVPALWTKHRRIAIAISRDYFLPGSEPQDVEQEALIGLWEAARTHDPALSSFPVWARRVIHAHLTDCLRAATRGKQAPLNQSLRMSLVCSEAGAVSELPHLHQVTDRVEDREQLRAVLDAIDRDLTPLERRSVLGVAAGLSYVEIGEPRQVDNALMRARLKLRAAA